MSKEGEQEHNRQPPALDADPPRQRRTRWLVGSASVRKGSFCPAVNTASRSSTYPNPRATRKKNTNTKVGELVGECGLERKRRPSSRRVGARQNWGWSRRQFLGWFPVLPPASSWVGHPAWLPKRLSSLGVGMLQYRVAQATVACVATATR